MPDNEGDMDPIDLRSFIHRVAGGYQDACGADMVSRQAANAAVEQFVLDNLPLLRHYLPHIIGACLAIEDQNDQQQGFWVHMGAGNHPGTQHWCASWRYNQGSYRDDGAYLALAAERLRQVLG